MTNNLSSLGFFSFIIGIMGLFIFNGYSRFLTFILGIGFGIVLIALGEILEYLKSIDERVRDNNKLIVNLNYKIEKFINRMNELYDIKGFTEASDNNVESANINGFHEDWECSHCGLINPYTESTCKKCGFY